MPTHHKIADKWRCIEWKLTNFSCSTMVRRPSAVNLRENSCEYYNFSLRNYSPFTEFFSLVAKDLDHVSHIGQLRKPQHSHKHQACHLEITLLSSFGHLESFKVILIDVSKNRTWCCRLKGIIMSTSSLKLTKIQHRENCKLVVSTTPLRFDDSSPRKDFEYLLQVIYVTKN